MRSEYEFELYGERFLAKVDSRGRVHSYERADDDSGWVGMDFGPNPFADAALRLARILDSLVGERWLERTEDALKEEGL